MFLAALVGTGIGRWLPDMQPCCVDLRQLVHGKLGIDDAQRRPIELVDRRYDVDHRRLLLQLRADDAALAIAYQRQPTGGPELDAAMEHVAKDIGDCQRAFVAHATGVRRVLRPAQAAIYDRAIVKALSETAP
ncbi:MAG: hypothetical protein ACRYG4_28140 [Janthinobacterium lividum]